MLDFMVISLPRSGSTWAANWLTTEHVFCKHDPLYAMHYEDFDSKIVSNAKVNGVSCTGLWRWADWGNNHPAKKLILRRDFSEIEQSMREIGFPALDDDAERQIGRIRGPHVDFKALFDPAEAKEIWKYLVGTKFDEYRHRELVDIEMQPKFIGLKINPEATRRLVNEIHSALMEN